MAHYLCNSLTEKETIMTQQEIQFINANAELEALIDDLDLEPIA